MTYREFVTELVRMVDGGNPPRWAKVPANEVEALSLIARFHTPASDWAPWKVGGYAEYLKSPGWRKRRAVVLILSRGCCNECDKEAKHVHHLTYERTGAELLRDLEPKCKYHHGLIHEKVRDMMTRDEWEEEVGTRMWWEKDSFPYGDSMPVPEDWRRKRK